MGVSGIGLGSAAISTRTNLETNERSTLWHGRRFHRMVKRSHQCTNSFKMNCAGLGNCPMKEEYDFSTAKRGPVTSSKGKTRITIMLDDDVIKAARERAENVGAGYQSVINHLLRQSLLSKTAHNLE